MSEKKQNNHSMFNSVEELKSFLLWAKKEGVQSFQLGEIQVNFSPYVVAETLSSSSTATGDVKDMLEPSENNNEEDLLYWSSR